MKVAAAAFFLVMVSTALSQTELTLIDGWKFHRADADLNAPFGSWESITIPHTWNVFDGQNGKKADPQYPSGYYRGPGWYVRKLDIPPDWRAQRVFVRFEAASLIADAYLNGRHLGQHRGAFAAFCYEITSQLRAEGANILRVRVDNSHTEEVMPLSGDFTVFGGIYRPVHLFAKPKVCISPLDYATSGVYVTTKKLMASGADLEIETKISSASSQPEKVTVTTELLDAGGVAIRNVSSNQTVSPQTNSSVTQLVSLGNPHRWNGRKDPYLYAVRVTLDAAGVKDQVTETTGLRTAGLTNEQGLVLNDVPYPIHGVNRHQEKQDKGWALTHADNEEDFQIIREIGATAVRLAHYQQSEDVHDICDHAGFLCWEEIPNVERVSDSPAFAENALQQLREMILQGYNHPSIIWHGIFNELNANWIKAPNGHVDPVPLLQDLYSLGKQLDPSRPIVGASWTTDNLPLLHVVDWQCYNTYPGWYWGKIEEFAHVIEKGSTTVGGKRVAISEYGAGANTLQHEEGALKKPNAGGPFHPEEYQALAHETEWAIAKDNPKLWGTFVWAMFDFASDGRDEGSQPGINDKGLVTHDRRIKKDAFYFYQANWTEKPMAYIAGRRMTPRKQATTEVKVYSNCAKVELQVNGQSLPEVAANSVHIFHWENVNLQPGDNSIAVVATNHGKEVRDSCTWTLSNK